MKMKKIQRKLQRKNEKKEKKRNKGEEMSRLIKRNHNRRQKKQRLRTVSRDTTAFLPQQTARMEIALSSHQCESHPVNAIPASLQEQFLRLSINSDGCCGGITGMAGST